MTFEITVESIEQDLQLAERLPGQAAVYIARAQVKATLLAAGSSDLPKHFMTGLVADSLEHRGLISRDGTLQGEALGLDVTVVRSDLRSVYTIPSDASRSDRIEAAAAILSLFPDVLTTILDREQPHLSDQLESTSEQVDDDFFAEERANRTRK